MTIVGIGSDIGFNLAKRFVPGANVEGTYYRTKPDAYLLAELDPFPNARSFNLVECDLTSNHAHMRSAYERLGPWDVLIFAAGTMEPIGRLDQCDTFALKASYMVNLVGPLQLLKLLYPKRKENASVVFFGGTNPNRNNPNYVAYSTAKCALLKAAEELDVEWPDVKVFSIAPGVVDTKIHRQTMDAGSIRAGEAFDNITSLYASGLPMTPHDEIYGCLQWCLSQPKEKIGGRNIHVVHDPWRGGHLRCNDHAGRLRRV